ncbi:Thiolase, N-terminal domain-containing protein [Aspergillus pseudoustus]|uniref:Thiolase, N-terminal domain-containing protein n=1 Tax=Aspergillus pseudoustus TaxID=1810923 RepID=A0ABR4JJR8_9EURO
MLQPDQDGEKQGRQERDYRHCNGRMKPARQCVLAAGLPSTTVCATLNKVCSSGMKAITLAAQSIASGQAHIVIAGGMESMSIAPIYFRRGGTKQQVVNGMLVDKLTDAYGKRHHMGIKAEMCASTHRISRAQQDEYAAQSYEKAQAAQQQGWFQEEITPIIFSENQVVDKDELNREKLPTLKPAFLPNGGRVAAVSSSELLQFFQCWADGATDPSHFTTAPALVIPKTLDRAGFNLGSIDAIEINEAYAVSTTANLKLLDLDRNMVNQHGGPLALGHPLGSSGCRIVVTLMSVLRQKGESVVCPTVCNEIIQNPTMREQALLLDYKGSTTGGPVQWCGIPC